MAKREEVKIKRTVSNEVMVKLLRDLAGSFEKGRVVIQGGDDFVTLEPVKHMNMAMEAACTKKGKEKIEIELSWKRFDEEGEKADDLVISDEEPAIEVESEETFEETEDVTSEETGEQEA